MIDCVTIESFKSFRAAKLDLAPLTLLVGANASGKSNAIEAMRLLSWLASGRRLDDVLAAIRDQELAIRGSLDDLRYAGGDVALGCELGEIPPALRPLRFSTTLKVDDRGLRVVQERLESPAIRSPFPLYSVVGSSRGHEIDVANNSIDVAYNSFDAREGTRVISCLERQAVFTQLATPARFAAADRRAQQVIPEAASILRRDLANVLFLDPEPRRMRAYSFLQEKRLEGDGAALSAVLFDLTENQDARPDVLAFIRSLPEQDIRDITYLRTPRNEVMVQLHETFGGKSVPREAALLSDGTLRALAVAAALLSVENGSTVVIEEIDNGVHPSRAEALLKNIDRVARERSLHVLLTTHNPALLDAAPVEAIPNIVACYRDPAEGDSKLGRLEDLETYPELVAQGPIGRLVTKGILDRHLKGGQSRRDVEEQLTWLADFRRRAQAS
jgi:predicted ATPase